MNKIEVNNLTFGYDDESNVLEDVSFSLEKGKYVSILGHNGSGKSTLSKLLIGLLKPKSGEIKIDGIEVKQENIAKIRAKMALVFQNPDNQFIGSSVENDIAFGLENKNVKHEDMRGIIEKFATFVGMEDYLDKEPSNLSGGQKQRVAIAGALAMNPEILILDEATSMLDPKGKSDINQLIQDLRRNNSELTVISITHDVGEAALSDEIIIIGKGKIIAQGKPKEVFKDEQELNKYNLTQPFIFKIKQELSSLGYDVNDCESIDDLVELICQ